VFVCLASWTIAGRPLRFSISKEHGNSNDPLFEVMNDGSVKLSDNLNADDKEKLRKVVVSLISNMYQANLLPFDKTNYAKKRGVLDRAPLEVFMDVASKELGDQPLQDCLEWGPYFTKWPGVTQPYMKKFKCKTQWTFHHETSHPTVRTLIGHDVYAELDRSLSDQGLDSIKGKFDLVIIPQTLQYVRDPEVSLQVLFDLVKPGGHLIMTTPFMQIVMPYPTDYYRFTAEGNELLLRKTGFEVVKSFVGGDDFWSVCWIFGCGTSDLDHIMASRALVQHGEDYSRSAYILSAQLAHKPVL